MNEVRKHPLTTDAAHKISQDYNYGEFIPDEAMLSLIDSQSDPDAVMTAADFQKKRLYEFSAIETIKAKLLEEYNYFLVREGRGFIVVEPSDQTKVAMSSLKNSLKSITRKAAKRLVYIDRERLSVDQQRENQEAIAKLSSLRKAARQSIGFEHKRLKD